MLELYLRSERGLARARASFAAPYLDGFAAWLREMGYCLRICASCITYAVHFGVWVASQDRPLEACDDGSVSAFLAHLQRCCCSGYRAGVHAVAPWRIRAFVRYLRLAGVIPVLVPQVVEPALVTGFCDWMRQQRGVTDSTLRTYRPVAIALVARLGDDPSCYEADALRAAVHQMAGGHGISMARLVANVARALLRYLAATGRCRPDLDAAILPVAGWKQASLPRYVSADDVQKIIDACDPHQPDGARDRAIVLLLCRLGMRGGDIVRMRLDDIEWGSSRIRVTGKGRGEARLPLTQEVGDAIIAYLGVRRGAATCDRLFLITRAPWTPLAETSCVSAIVRRAMSRAGVTAPTRGAHLLRHSAATAMLREGISLPTIGVVLRHRSVETTAHYAKVDVELLASVAQPWIGGVPC